MSDPEPEFERGDRVRLLTRIDTFDTQGALFTVPFGTLGEVYEVRPAGNGFDYDVAVPWPGSPDSFLFLTYEGKDAFQIEKVTP